MAVVGIETTWGIRKDIQMIGVTEEVQGTITKRIRYFRETDKRHTMKAISIATKVSLNSRRHTSLINLSSHQRQTVIHIVDTMTI
jgi:hypothetical protein